VTELSWKESELILFVVRVLLFGAIIELLTRKPHRQILEYFVPKNSSNNSHMHTHNAISR